MDNFKKVIKKRIIYLAIFVIFLSVILIVSRFLSLSTINSHFISFVHGFQLGGITVIILSNIYWILKYNKALKDEHLLKKLYIKENDERLIAIYNKSGGFVVKLLIIIFFVTSYIFAYFNIIVYFTLVIAVLIISFVYAGFYFYYNKKL